MQADSTPPRQTRSRIARVCEHCGASFSPYAWNAGRFCSLSCSSASRGRPLWERLCASVVFGQPPTHRPELGPCWLWTGATTVGGYGHITRMKRDPGTGAVHRIVYEQMVGPIGPGLEVDHLCRVTACCNPFHLEPVTGQINQLRGTGFGAVNAAKTHCIRGHAFNDENTYITKAGSRLCLTCQRDRGRERYYAMRKSTAPLRPRRQQKIRPERWDEELRYLNGQNH